MGDPKISIIIPTYNHLETLKKCVRSIDKNTDFSKGDCEVIVVANGCEDETAAWVEGMGAPYRLLSYPEPLGFVRAMNAGFSVSSGEYLLSLNDDTEILDWGNRCWLDILAAPLESDSSVAITGATRDVWARGRYFIVFYCAMVRRSVLREFGMLDESFGVGCGEDCDLSMKAQDRGYKVVQVPEEMDYWGTRFPIWHVGHLTVGYVPGIEAKAKVNTAILEDRYPRTEADRECGRKFSEGLQNISLWAKAEAEATGS